MTRCFDCKRLAPLGPKPKSDDLLIQEGHRGMLASGLAQCGYRAPDQTYARFRSCDSDADCPYFILETDEEKRSGRRKVAAALQQRFTTWMRALKANNREKITKTPTKGQNE